MLVDVDCDIYITGSNSKLLSGELATLIAGRYIQIRVYPFALSEAKAIQKQNGKYTSDEALFADDLRYGGLPMRFSLEDISLEPYLSDTYDAIVVKDIVARNRIKDTRILHRILTFLMDHIANPFSARSIVAALKAEGIHTTVETVLSYMDYIKRAMIVYLELLYRGYDVKVGKMDDYEIDFVAYKGANIVYVQVCYLLASAETIEREFGNRERIKDNYPKYVVSGDLPDVSRNGIQHYNIIKFLLNE